MNLLSLKRVRELLDRASQTRVLVVGDVMLDQFIWGRVTRISPEAPVPVVEFERESFMPGGAANVARNLTALGGQSDLFGVVGRDASASQLRRLLGEQRVGCDGLLPVSGFHTATKTRIVAQKQQVTRLDRETRGDISPAATQKLVRQIEAALDTADAVSVGDYAKGVVTQPLVDALRERCRARGRWLSLDPKPGHTLDIRGLSLLTPNRKEAFELAGLADTVRHADPLQDEPLMQVVAKLLGDLRPALLLVTLGELGMLLCQQGQKPFHVPTVAQEVFDVSGAGDTVIASFTLAIAAGASPMEAAVFSNHAAGVVVGKIGTATVTPEELIASFAQHS
ncbi:MAG: carbohydrate kinase [Verrucomicrobia bacterium]|nr:carbohydrate kinase [Verrucomicrobiota bacterium]